MSRVAESPRLRRFAAVLSLSLFIAVTGCSGGGPAAGPWGGANLIQPADLAAELADSTAAKPMLVHVGVAVLYRAGAIPGSRYAGPGSNAAGIASLRALLKDVPRDTNLVIYCGCCPAANCPNMKPAWAAVRDMGFTNAKALMIADNFDKDWADKGYPTEKPQN